jgi:hypothetical protein
MFTGIVKSNRPFAVRQALRYIRREHQRGAHETMPDHERHGRPLEVGRAKDGRPLGDRYSQRCKCDIQA